MKVFSKRIAAILVSILLMVIVALWQERSSLIVTRDYFIKRVDEIPSNAEDKTRSISEDYVNGNAENTTKESTACNLKNLLSDSFTITDLKNFQEECQLIQYNKCMKSGSTTFLTLIIILCNANKVSRLNRYRNSSQKYFPVEKQRFDALDYTNTSHPRPLVIAMHRFFIQYHDFQVDQPFLINVVRHPIGRTISHFFYETFHMGKYAIQNFQKGVVPKGTVEDCARAVYPFTMCNVFFGNFCEDKALCSKRDEYALVKAKKNIEEYGIIVGLTEELYGFIEVLEILYPRLFKGACAIYNRTVQESLKKSNTTTVQREFPIPPSVVSDLPHILRTEIELYEFIRQRYYAVRKKVFNLLQRVQR